ncbi:hypothetical protein LOY54_04655 [Pseudomonas sp. B21-032]|uniref:hypothetical protein n=1 Tax=Pseudomonas sp. B21-032 TaxID=2895483 RepID=UPI00215EFE93|nr:hypothetical protein [Pseudomonas sp. B21-032]UVL62566.1 hypothetical protein LOY54_04655 [Pseudomonas sp. B21-032]
MAGSPLNLKKMLAAPMRANKKTIIHTQPGKEYEDMRPFQHHVSPDHTQEKNLTIYALASGTTNIAIPAITEAIVPFRIDLKELSLMFLPELGVNDVVQPSLSPCKHLSSLEGGAAKSISS